MVEGILLLLVGIALLGLSLFVRKIAKRAKTMTNQPTFSRTAHGAANGVYYEHGMLRKKGSGFSVVPQYKKSGSYYESLI